MVGRLALLVMSAVVSAGCAAAGPIPSLAVAPVAASTASPTPSPSPTSSPLTGTADPFAGLTYAFDLPAGWVMFDPTGDSSKSAIDAVVKANPALAVPMAMLTSSPTLRVAVNPVLGTLVITQPFPATNASIKVIGQNFAAQIKQAYPGVTIDSGPTLVDLPGGEALHWAVSMKANNPNGGMIQVTESIFLISHGSNSVMLNFASPNGAVNPDEAAIANSIRIQP